MRLPLAGARSLTWFTLAAVFVAACSSSERDFTAPASTAGSNGKSGEKGNAGEPSVAAGGKGAAGEASSAEAGTEADAGAAAVPAPCADSPCLNGGACAESGTVFTCDCADGFGGARCQTNIDDCS